MTGEHLEILLEDRDWGRDIEFVLVLRKPGMRDAYAVPKLKMQVPEVDGAVEATGRMTRGAARRLMDELWRIGIRPGNEDGNLGKIGALEKHLGDMRKLVEKFLDVKF